MMVVSRYCFDLDTEKVMESRRVWPVGDREWVARYRMSIAGKNVPVPSLEERERELLEAIYEMKASAVELFGNAEELAEEDAAELATVDEVVRTSLGAGLQPALREAGGMLVGIGAVAGLLLVIRSGWVVDIDSALTLVAASVLVIFVGWIVGRAFVSAGRWASAICAGAGVSALAVAGIAYAADLGSGHIVASDVPMPLLALGMLAPGVAALVLSSRMPQQVLRQNWDDAEWLHSFRGGLRSRLMPAATARGHVAEIEQTLAAGEASAYSEFGHPLTLATEVAAADRTAQARLWAVSTIARAGGPLCIAVLVLANQSWGALTVPVAVAFVLVAAAAAVVGWHRRPWRSRR